MMMSRRKWVIWRGGMGTENSSESRMSEVGGRVRVCWDLWGRVARAHREDGGGW